MMADDIRAALRKAYPGAQVEAAVDNRGIVTLSGTCESWARVVGIGHLAAKQPGVRNVVNHLTAAGVAAPEKDWAAARRAGEALGEADDVDVLVVGAGVSGCAVARELSRYKLNVLVAEMAEDVSCGATKANNGNIHPGHAAKPGTLKAKLNVEGNRMYTRWAEELGFDLKRSGAMGFITNWALLPALWYTYNTAKKNGVDGVRIVYGKEARVLEPGLDANGFGRRVKAALWLPSMGLVEPYKVCVALAENAAQNGVRFLFDCTVAGVLTENGAVAGALTSRGVIRAKYIVNCAGVYADEVSAMAGDECYTIHPRKGVIAILDKNRKPEFDSLCEHVTLDEVKRALKNTQTKGGGMCYTPEGNVLMGPSAAEVPDKEDLASAPQDLAYAMGRGGQGAPGYGDIIRFFTGVRPADYKEDFVIEQSPVTSGFINVGAIQSPGLAAAPAVAEMAAGILADEAARRGAPLAANPAFDPRRPREVEFRHMSRERQDALIAKDARYGRVICRCETITEGEILDAVRSPVVPVSVDAIKRRTRAGMGRCQGGFCQPRVLELLARELGRGWVDVNLRDAGTNILVADTRPEAGRAGKQEENDAAGGEGAAG